MPGFALQLQKQLATKLQESRVRCRESAELGLESLRSTELHGAAGEVARVGELPASLAATAACSMVEKLRQVECWALRGRKESC